MRLYEHGLKVVLRKIDNFLPTLGADHLLSGRGGLTRREIARHSPADAEGYDDYSAALDSVVAILRDWILRAPPNAGGGLADVLAALKLGNAVRGMSRRGAAPPARLLHQVRRRHPRPLFRHRHRPGPVRLRRGRRQLCQPLRSGLGLRPPPPSVRRSGRRPRRLGPCDRRHGRDHPGDGEGGAREGRRDHPRHAGRGDHRRARPRRRRRRGRQDLAGQGGRGERQPALPLRRPAARRRGRSGNLAPNGRLGGANRRPSG